MKNKKQWLLTLLLGAVIAGCGKQAPSEEVEETAETAEEAETVPEEEAVDLLEATEEAEEKSKTGLKAAGKKVETSTSQKTETTSKNSSRKQTSKVYGSDYILDTPYFYVQVPKSWSETVKYETGARTGGGYWLKIMEPTSYEAGAGGVIGTIMMIPTAEDFSNLPDAEWLGMLTDQNNAYNLLWLKPTDLQFSPATEKAYRNWEADMEEVAWSVTGIDPYVRTITGR